MGNAFFITECIYIKWSYKRDVYKRQGYDYPLSVFLTRMNGQNIGVLCTCGVLAALPVVLLFLYYDRELTEGVTLSQL